MPQTNMQRDSAMDNYQEIKEQILKAASFASWFSIPVQVLIRRRFGLRFIGPFALLITCGLLILYGFTTDDPLASLKQRGSASSTATAPMQAAPAGLPPVSTIPPKEKWTSPGLPSNWWEMDYSAQNLWAYQHPKETARIQADFARREAAIEADRTKNAAAITAKAEADATRQERKDHWGRLALGYLGIAALIVGFWKRSHAWRQIKAGNHWHTRHTGMPYLQAVSPFRDRITSRILEPIAVYVLGFAVRYFLPALGYYLMICAVSLWAMEQVLYNRDIARYLDMLDVSRELEARTDDESHHHELLGKKAPTGKAAFAEFDRRGGIPTAPAPQLIDEAKKRRELAAAAVAAAEEEE